MDHEAEPEGRAAAVRVVAEAEARLAPEVEDPQWGEDRRVVKAGEDASSSPQSHSSADELLYWVGI